MPYSNQADVEFYGQFSSSDFSNKGYSYQDGIQKAIADADRMIDEYCDVPEGFFIPGGIEIQQEHLNGTDVIYIGGIQRFYAWFAGATSHLKFAYKPVLSVTKLEEETSAGIWTTRTKGSNSDYIVVDDGVRFVQNTPAWKFKNVRVTYKAGYKTIPWQIVQVSGRLAAALLKYIKDKPAAAGTSQSSGVSLLGVSKSSSSSVSQGGAGQVADAVFTPDLRELLNNFRRANYGFG